MNIHKEFNSGGEDCIKFIRLFLNNISIENNLNKNVSAYEVIDHDSHDIKFFK